MQKIFITTLFLILSLNAETIFLKKTVFEEKQDFIDIKSEEIQSKTDKYLFCLLSKQNKKHILFCMNQDQITKIGHVQAIDRNNSIIVTTPYIEMREIHLTMQPNSGINKPILQKLGED